MGTGTLPSTSVDIAFLPHTRAAALDDALPTVLTSERAQSRNTHTRRARPPSRHGRTRICLSYILRYAVREREQGELSTRKKAEKKKKPEKGKKVRKHKKSTRIRIIAYVKMSVK